MKYNIVIILFVSILSLSQTIAQSPSVANNGEGDQEYCNCDDYGFGWQYDCYGGPAEAYLMELPVDLIIDCDGSVSACTPLNYDNGFTGACANSGTVPCSQIATIYDPCSGGSVSYSWSGTDLLGNELSYSRSVMISPVPAASFLDPPLDLILPCGTVMPEIMPLNFGNGAIDACSNSGTITGVTDDSQLCSSGLMTYLWEGVDICGNTLTHFQTISYEDGCPADTEPPVISCGPDIYMPSEPGFCEAFVGVPLPSGFDNCGLAGMTNSWSGTGDPSGLFPVGFNEIVWTMFDEAGNIASCTQIVTVEDAEPPFVTCQNAVVMLDPSGFGFLDPAQVMVERGDNCGATTIFLPQTEFTTADIGTLFFTGMIIDGAGNTTTCDYIVEVIPGTGNCVDLQLIIQFDAFPHETFWEIRDEANNLIQQGGPYPEMPPGTAIPVPMCLPQGCYMLTMLDAGGNGLCCDGGAGFYQLMETDSGILHAEGSAFEFEEVTPFCVSGF